MKVKVFNNGSTTPTYEIDSVTSIQESKDYIKVEFPNRSNKSVKDFRIYKTQTTRIEISINCIKLREITEEEKAFVELAKYVLDTHTPIPQHLYQRYERILRETA